MNCIPVKTHPNYTVCVDGTITNSRGIILATRLSNSGYLQVSLWKDNRETTYYIHRLIAEHFIDNPLNKSQVNHIDGCKLNNSVSNLEWVTRSENSVHAYKNGLAAQKRSLCDTDVLACLASYVAGASLSELADKYGTVDSTIYVSMEKWVAHNPTSTTAAAYISAKQNRRKLGSIKAGLTQRKLKRIVMELGGTIIMEFNSIAEAQHYLNVKSSGPISNALSGRTKTAYGYIWKYITSTTRA